MERVLVSACLVGLQTRYDSTDALSQKAIEELKGCIPVPVCPEQLGGLSTPRARAWLTRDEGRAGVVDEFDSDVTEQFRKGALAVAEIARITGAQRAFMKEGSPSCGVTSTHVNGKRTPGVGVTSELLADRGLELKGFD